MSTLVSGHFPSSENTDISAQQPIPKTCQSCFRNAKCWGGGEHDIGELLQDWEATYSMTKKGPRRRVEEKIKNKCIRFNGLVTELEEQAANRLLTGQLQHESKNACAPIAGYERAFGQNHA